MAQFFMLASKLARLKDSKDSEEKRKITRTILARTIAGPAYPTSYNWDAADRVLAIFDIQDIPEHHPRPGPRIGRSEVGQSPRASTATEGVDRVAGNCTGTCCHCETRCCYSRTNHKGACCCKFHRSTQSSLAATLSSLERCPNCKSADILPHTQDMKICVACNHRWYPAAVALGKLGGTSKSRKKQAASRRNGKLGGRPGKRPLGRGEGGGE